jgi:hypothetical protein
MQKHLTFSLALLTLLCTSAHAQLPSYLPADGLVGWWPFNGNANDESGNGNDGTVNGATLAEDRNGVENAAYNFDGNSHVLISDSPSLQVGEQLTISLWLNWSVLQNSLNMILQKGTGGGCTNSGYYFSFDDNGGLIPFAKGIVYAGSSCAAISDTTHLSNSWHQITIVYSPPTDNRIYFDGSMMSGNYSNCSSCVISNSNNPLVIGKNLFGGGFGWNGQIDDIAIYNRALTPQEIQNIYTGTVPAACLQLPSNLQEGLVGYWPFCGDANDESGNGNNGTVNGATLVEDRFGNAGSAYSFDGLDDYIIANASTALDASSYSEITLSAWVNTVEFSPTGSASKIITHTSIDGSNGQQYALSVQHDSALYFLAGTGQFEANGINVSSAVLFTNQWQHAIMTYDGESVRFYINGNLVFTKQESDNFPTSPTGALVFSSIQSSQYNRLYNGLLDDIAIYNRALTPEEVTQLYAVQSTGDPTAGGGGNTTGPLANVPRGIPYQAAARDAQGQAIASSPVNVRFTLHEGTPSGTAEYSETHSLTTNEIGLFSTYFGSGTAITSAFDSIVWSNTTKFLQVEIDLGNGYVDMGTQQLMSVPFSYRANEAAAAGTIRNNALPVYADNTAALAGGLVAGEMYRTATGDLKVVY